MSIGASFWWWDALSHQPVQTREETLGSGNFSAVVEFPPPYHNYFTINKIQIVIKLFTPDSIVKLLQLMCRSIYTLTCIILVTHSPIEDYLSRLPALVVLPVCQKSIKGSRSVCCMQAQPTMVVIKNLCQFVMQPFHYSEIERVEK